MNIFRFNQFIYLMFFFVVLTPTAQADFPISVSNDLTNKFKILWQRTGFGAVAKPPLCPAQQVQLKTFTCPADLLDKVFEPFERRAYKIVESTIWERCHSQFESRKSDISKRYEEFPTAASMQSSFAHSELAKLGQFTNGVARTCAQDKELGQNVIVSRFYSLAGRLNLAAAQNSRDLVRLDKILGHSSTICPDQYFLSEAYQICEQEKKCPSNFDLKRLSAQANKDLISLNQSKEELKKWPKDCGEDSNCENIKLNHSKIIAGLIKQNPWFLDNTYMDQSFYEPSKRLSYYFSRTQKKLARYQSEISEAAKCIHLPDQSNCSMDKMRDLIVRTPSLQLTDDNNLQTKKLNSHLKLQECIDEVSIERDETAKALSPLIEFVATAPVALGAAAKGTVQAAKATIPRLTALLGNEIFSNLSSYSESLKAVGQACIEKKISLAKTDTQKSNDTICDAEGSFLSNSQFEEGHCLVESGLAALALVSPALAVSKLGSAVKTAVTESSAESALLKNRVSSQQRPLAELGAATTERRIGSQVSHTSTVERHAVKEQLLHAEYTTEQENLKWIKIAKSDTSGNKKFIEIENSKMKFLNDSLVDKDLITSLTNMHKQLTLEEFEILKKKYPQLKFSPYSDFKSMRFAVEGPIPPGFEDDLNKAFSRIQTKYKDWALKNNLVRDSDRPESWFKMGSGDRADEASVAARYARTEEVATAGFNFNSPEVKKALADQLRDSDSQRQALMKQLKGSSLIQKIDGDVTVLKPEIFEILRKSSDAKEAAIKIEKRFGLQNFSEDVAGQMLAYAKSVDQFSPSLYIGKREVASLDAAVHGGFSIDFVGMGAHNLYGTAAALAGKSDLDTALINARKAEGEVTSLFQERRQMVKDVSEGSIGKKLDTLCSGDDCIGITKAPMTTADKQQLINNLANSGDGANVRVAFIQAGIENTEARTQIATHGEGIEKNLRSQLEGVIEPQRLKGLLFAIDMQSKSVGTGSASLLMANSRNVTLSEKETKLINEAFRNAVKDFNKNLPGFVGYAPK